MSPRGVARPDVRERLFAAAERVLARGGPTALTSRAVTSEAGCAKGLLHNHFRSLDGFLVELALDRVGRVAQRVGRLADEAGKETVRGNVLGAALALLDAPGPMLAGLAATRPVTFAHVRQAMYDGESTFKTIQQVITDYLEAERAIGRLPADADTATLGLALVGTVHHLLMTSGMEGEAVRRHIERLVALLLPYDEVPG
jgi:AcrR family transcriptional regulator